MLPIPLLPTILNDNKSINNENNKMTNYLPKKGDIVLYNSFSDTIECDVVGNPKAFEGKDYQLVGLSLERIKADYISKEVQRKRDEKLIIMIRSWVIDKTIDGIEDMTLPALDEELRKVFAEVDK